MLASLLDTQNVLCRTEAVDEILRRQNDRTWAAGCLQLDIDTERLEHGVCLRPVLLNTGDNDVTIESVRLLEEELQLSEPGLRFLRFGLQSPGDATRFGVLTAEGVSPPAMRVDNACFPDPEKPHVLQATSLFACAPHDRSASLVIGGGTFRLSEGRILASASLEDPNCFSIGYEMALDGIRLAAGASLDLDAVVVLEGPRLQTLLVEWADFTAGQAGARIPETTPTGWNDWQFYRNEKSQEHVRESAQVMAELRKQGYPLDFIQIDGGFCLHLSEWREPGPRFPDGIGKLSKEVRDMGLHFGLWFAPYIQNVNTRVVREHPEWLLLDKTGKQPVRRDRSNVGPCCLLDFTVPAALEWLRDQVRFFVNEWQVRWIKLDGPHCTFYREGRLRDRSRTVAQMLGTTFEVIRDAAGPEVIVEGEGIMGPALGKVDLHRMQQDNHPVWYSHHDRRRAHAPCVYGNELMAGFLHGRWWCNHRENVILRDYASPFWHGRETEPDAIEPIFTEAELQTQLTAAVLGSGGILLTDPMPDLMRTPHRARLISKLLPPYSRAAEVVDAFPDHRYPNAYRLVVERSYETYTVLGVVNWSDETLDVDLALEDVVPDARAHEEFLAFSFFDSRMLGSFKGRLPVQGVSAHGARLIALRPRTGRPQLVSTSLHLLQGAVDLENVQWHEEANELEVIVKHFIQQDERLFFVAPPGWELTGVDTNAARFSVDDYDPRAPMVRFDGAGDGGATRFLLAWQRS